MDEIKRSISISVYYGWKRSIKNARWREIDLKIIFWLQISFSPHSGTNTKIKWDMCLCIIKHHTKICRWYLLVVILKIDIKYTFLLDFIYFHETIDFSLTSVTSSHVQIWKIVTKIVVGIKVLYNQGTTKAIRFIYNLSIFRPISALIIPTPLSIYFSLVVDW
jgi:hypothetical protein